jgi:hypothetical protein
MKAMVGYGVFQKPEMLRWMCEGIKENFPPDTLVQFYFEADNSDGEDQLYSMGLGAGLGLRMLPPMGTTENILEHGVHRKLIEWFVDSECELTTAEYDSIEKQLREWKAKPTTVDEVIGSVR